MKATSLDRELEALKVILLALEPLDPTQRSFVLKTVAERLGISTIAPAAAGSRQEPHGAGKPASGSATAVGDINGSLDAQTPKQFLKAKLPKTDVQRVACLAFYLTHARNQSRFDTEAITKLNTEALGTRLSNPSAAVNNAMNQNRFLAPVGQGNKQITGLGEDVVNALPDQEVVKAVIAAHRKPRKKTAKKAAAKNK
jgi:hypothetical protein